MRTLETQQIIDELRDLLVREFGLAESREMLPADASLFGSEIGLCSLDGLELLTTLEDEYGVILNDDLLFDATPTLRSLATYLVSQGAT